MSIPLPICILVHCQAIPINIYQYKGYTVNIDRFDVKNCTYLRHPESFGNVKESVPKHHLTVRELRWLNGDYSKVVLCSGIVASFTFGADDR